MRKTTKTEIEDKINTYEKLVRLSKLENDIYSLHKHKRLLDGYKNMLNDYKEKAPAGGNLTDAVKK